MKLLVFISVLLFGFESYSQSDQVTYSCNGNKCTDSLGNEYAIGKNKYGQPRVFHKDSREEDPSSLVYRSVIGAHSKTNTRSRAVNCREDGSCINTHGVWYKYVDGEYIPMSSSQENKTIQSPTKQVNKSQPQEIVTAEDPEETFELSSDNKLIKVTDRSISIFDKSGERAAGLSSGQFFTIHGSSDKSYCVSVSEGKCNLYVGKDEVDGNSKTISSTKEAQAYPKTGSGVVSVFPEAGLTWEDNRKPTLHDGNIPVRDNEGDLVKCTDKTNENCRGLTMAWPNRKSINPSIAPSDNNNIPIVDSIEWQLDEETGDAIPYAKVYVYAVNPSSGKKERVTGYINANQLSAQYLEEIQDVLNSGTPEQVQKVLGNLCQSLTASCGSHQKNTDAFREIILNSCEKNGVMNALKAPTAEVLESTGKCIADDKYSATKPYFVRQCIEANGKVKLVKRTVNGKRRSFPNYKYVLVKKGLHKNTKKYAYKGSDKLQADGSCIRESHIKRSDMVERPFIEQLELKTYSEHSSAPVFNGKALSPDQVRAIDILARTVYGEMRSCHYSEGKPSPSYPLSVLRTITERADNFDDYERHVVRVRAISSKDSRYKIVPEKTSGNTKTYTHIASGRTVTHKYRKINGGRLIINEDLKKTYGLPTALSREQRIARVAGAPAQYSTWNNGDTNLYRVLCPSRSPKMDRDRWPESVALATQAVLNTEFYDSYTSDLDNITHYTSPAALTGGTPSWAKKMTEVKPGEVNIAGQSLTRTNRCIQLYK